MFHLKYPASQTFFTWDEMGCLCRALGFQATMIQVQQQSYTEEIPYKDEGVSLKNMQRMFEMNVFNKVLHRTCNMHTADWNWCVITKALHLLTHKALSFEDLHSVRVAYLTYEHIDMKGMPLVKHTLLRTLKMCGRTIAPMKLMHRLKHMKGEFEERGRIQLYEFLDLILWCDLYTSYTPNETEACVEKDDELFRLVDFKQLLSHHDQRMSIALDQVYLKEEWDFGMETLGPKTLFNEPVVHTEARIALAQIHKKNYHGLKHEVTQAQKRVYRAHAGSIRPRPISAPKVDKYRRKEEMSTHGRSTAHDVYESVQKRLHSAPSRTTTGRSIERPIVTEHARAHTPSVVSGSELKDVQLKMETLDFDINTLDVRCQLQVDREMEFYIPDYPEKLANRIIEVEPVPEPERKKIHWTSKITNNLAYPTSNMKPAHAKNCDARFRGWEAVNKKQGYHTVITSDCHDISEKGRLFAKMEQTAMEPVEYLHPNYVVRYTPKNMTHQGRRVQRTQIFKPSIDLKGILSNRTDDKDDVNSDGKMNQSQKTKADLDSIRLKYLKDGEIDQKDIKNTEINNGTAGNEDQKSYPKGLSAQEEVKTKSPQSQSKNAANTSCNLQDTGHHRGTETADDILVPQMVHSKPKIVDVGQIGTISLLESIQESRDLEEKFDEETSSSFEPPLCTIDLPSDEMDSIEPDDNNIDDAEKLNKMLQLNIKDQLPSQYQIKSRKSRGARSAPTSLRGRKSSPRKESPRKIPRRKSSDKRVKSADDIRKATRVGERKINDGRSSQSSDPDTNHFSTTRGSVTSDENEKAYTAPRDNASSVYSEAMTIASSTGIKELSSPSPRRESECVATLPDINMELEIFNNGSNVEDWRPGQRVQFDMMLDMRKNESIKLPFSDVRQNSQTSLLERVRLENTNTEYECRSLKTDPDSHRTKLSRQIRSRLISRVENAISPDLKSMLMIGSLPITSS